MEISKEQIAALCQLHARELELPKSGELAQRDPARILWAFAGVESSFGANVSPRHERAYCWGGRYLDLASSKAWGCLAHCSYGPWQVMFANYPIGLSPRDLMDDIAGGELCIRAALRRFNQALRQGATKLAELADAYNSGNFKDAIVPLNYLADIESKYLLAMPLLAQGVSV